MAYRNCALLIAAAGCAWLPASATVTAAGPTIAAVQNGFKVSYATNGTPLAGAVRSYASAATGEASVMDLFSAAGPRGAQVAVTAARTIPYAAIAGALARTTGIGLAAVAADAMLSSWLGAAKVYPGTPEQPGAQIERTDQHIVDRYVYPEYASYIGLFSDHGSACNAYLAFRRANDSNGSYTGGVTGSDNPNIKLCTYSRNGIPYGSVQQEDVIGQWCADEAGRLTVKPTGGQCPGVVRRQPATEGEVAAELQRPSARPAPAAAAEALVRANVPIEGESPARVSGPAAGPSVTRTSSGPAGTTTTVINNYYTYEGDTLTWNESSTTTLPDGSKTTSTDAAPADQRSDCEKNPDSVGCQKLGEIEPTELQKENVNVAITPDTGWGEGPGSCPPPRSIHLHGSDYMVEWTLFCDFSRGVRPVVIGVAWLTAGIMFIGMGRKS